MKRGRYWRELADWYDKNQGDTGDLWHRAIIDPALLKMVGDCRGKEVLDLGCGNGYPLEKAGQRRGQDHRRGRLP